MKSTSQCVLFASHSMAGRQKENKKELLFQFNTMKLWWGRWGSLQEHEFSHGPQDLDWMRRKVKTEKGWDHGDVEELMKWML